jgi:hypothetical protein
MKKLIGTVTILWFAYRTGKAVGTYKTVDMYETNPENEKLASLKQSRLDLIDTVEELKDNLIELRESMKNAVQQKKIDEKFEKIVDEGGLG